MVDGWCTFEMWRALHAGLVFPQVDVLFLHDFYSGHTDLSPEHPATEGSFSPRKSLVYRSARKSVLHKVRLRRRRVDKQWHLLLSLRLVERNDNGNSQRKDNVLGRWC